MAKVSDLLRLPAFRGIHVLSGENGLQRKVGDLINSISFSSVFVNIAPKTSSIIGEILVAIEYVLFLFLDL